MVELGKVACVHDMSNNLILPLGDEYNTRYKEFNADAPFKVRDAKTNKLAPEMIRARAIHEEKMAKFLPKNVSFHANLAAFGDNYSQDRNGRSMYDQRSLSVGQMAKDPPGWEGPNGGPGPPEVHCWHQQPWDVKSCQFH